MQNIVNISNAALFPQLKMFLAAKEGELEQMIFICYLKGLRRVLLFSKCCFIANNRQLDPNKAGF